MENYTISRRKYWIIFLMMAVLLFMFQFSQVIKERGNEYDTNSYVSGDLPSGKDTWTISEVSDAKDVQGEYVLFVGKQNTALYDTVCQWCTYTKRNMMLAEEFESISFENSHKPSTCLLDPTTVDVCSNVDDILNLAKQDIVIIFCNLPKVDQLTASQDLMDMLGIDEVTKKTTIEGIRVFDGFLLGGEAVYKASHKNDLKKQDFDLEIPWYITGKGTKTYMVGLKDEKEVKRERFPRLIWRNTLGGTTVFAVNGDFLDTLAGIGILDAMIYESKDYDLYPVVNAQNIVVADYPTLTNENEEKMMEIYSRNSETAVRDIFWPGLLSMSAQNDLKMTCYMTTKYDFSSEAAPNMESLVFYMRQLKEAKAEAGRSLSCVNADLQIKINHDNIFLQNGFSNYQFSAVYAKELNDELKQALDHQNGILKANTLTCENTEGYPLISYYTDDVTLLGVTNMADEFTYSADFRMRSLISGLGYSNVFVDLNNVIWPESKEDYWENYFDKVHSNVSTYYSKHYIFDKTTMSEADERARAFLNMSFSQSRDGNHILLRIKNMGENGYFVLRTHGEDIDTIHGGTYTKLERDVYLIHATGEVVDMIMKDSEDIMTYETPFAGRE